jgi:hypothetical protein
MEPKPARCSDCGGEMETGFMLDYSYAALLQQRWVKDAPKFGWLGGLKVKQDATRAVLTERCKGCGLLKSYAR